MRKPNIIVIMADQMKATASQLYWEHACPTPALQRLANEGVLYHNAFTPHPLCVPARVSLWTSQYPHSHGCRRNETLMKPEAVHAFKIWKEMGYHAALIGKNHCFEAQSDLKLFDTWCEISHSGLQGAYPNKGMPWFRPVQAVQDAHTIRNEMMQDARKIEKDADYWRHGKFASAVTNFPLEDYSTGLIAGQTCRFIEQHQHQPFALWVSFPDPHTPYEVPEQYANLCPPELITLPPWNESALEHMPESSRILFDMLGIALEHRDDLRQVLSVYYGMLRFIDDAVGQIVQTLEQTGLRENTIVVFCADHGDFMGERSMTAKGGVFYDCLTRIPLIISWPGHIPTAQVDDSMVNLIDVVPTLFTLQGLDCPRTFQGRPLPIATENSSIDVAFSEYGTGGPPFTMQDAQQLPTPHGYHSLLQSLYWREAAGRRKMVRTKEWKYVYDPSGREEELYHLFTDPWELENVIDYPEYTHVIHTFRQRLLAWGISTEDMPPVPLPECKLNL